MRYRRASRRDDDDDCRVTHERCITRVCKIINYNDGNDGMNAERKCAASKRGSRKRASVLSTALETLEVLSLEFRPRAPACQAIFVPSV
jgi:hypothetical protein